MKFKVTLSTGESFDIQASSLEEAWDSADSIVANQFTYYQCRECREEYCMDEMCYTEDCEGCQDIRDGSTRPYIEPEIDSVEAL